MSRIYIPTQRPEDWQQFLAEPAKQWRTGYSAKSVAHSWEAADGLPPEIAGLFRDHSEFGEGGLELLAAFPEWKVPLPGGSRESQNNVFALVRCGDATVALMIEAKVAEPFGPTLKEWLSQPSEGKSLRLEHISDVLGLPSGLPNNVRYQLLHRTASAMIEAQRFGTSVAAMVVHSFSPERLWFNDYLDFCRLFGVQPQIGELVRTVTKTGKPL